MLDCGLLRPSQTDDFNAVGTRKRETANEMDLLTLFIGFHPDDVFGRLVSVDMAELMVVFGAIAISLGIMVVFGNWWSR